MIDPDTYRTTKVNRDLRLVYKGKVLVGQVRHGLDHKWYAELPGTIGMAAAVQALIIATEAIEQYLEAVGGQR